jgi:tetratricopeptide (TPR) repeat protein
VRIVNSGALRRVLICFLIGSALRGLASFAADTPAELGLAQSYLRQSRYADAEKVLRSFIADHAADADARYLLGYVLFREDKPAESLSVYTEAARLRKPLAENLRTVSLDYVLLKDYPDAEHWIKSALSLDPDDAEAWYQLGRIQYTLNRFHDSVTAFQRSLDLDPASVKAENNLGLALEGLNRTDEAVAAYRKAIVMQTESKAPSEQPLLNLAKVLVDRNQLDEALPMLEKAQRIAPHDWKVLEQLGRLQGEKGDLEAAAQAFEQAIAIEPQRASLHFQLGQVYRKSGAVDKAAREFALVQQLQGTHSTPER